MAACWKCFAHFGHRVWHRFTPTMAWSKDGAANAQFPQSSTKKGSPRDVERPTATPIDPEKHRLARNRHITEAIDLP